MNGDSAAPAVALAEREASLARREAAATLREQEQREVAERQGNIELRQWELREANAHLVVATLTASGMTEAAETARRLQDEFLAMLGHELRNPLSAIGSAAAMLDHMGPAAGAVPVVAVIHRQAEHMARLLDDLLDVSRVTRGKVTLQRRRVAASEFVAAAVQTYGALIESRQQRLTVDLGAPPNDVDGDPVRLSQVVGNLLHNAAKYTPTGGAIALSARRDGENLVIRIADNGMGISAEALPHVFDLFKQDERALGRSQGGLGIGLTVVRSMVELHGGTVAAKSAGLDQGSEFIVTLPRLPDRADGAVAPQPALPIGAIGAAAAVIPARILLVEDNEDAGDMMAMILRLAGHEVTLARSGEDALAVFLAARPQVVVCDVGLPGMSGYELAARLREQRRGPMPLMIALTGYGGVRERDLSLAAGFAHHLVKPADPQAILRLISAGLASSA